MPPVQRTQSLEEVLIARDVSPQSSPSSGTAVQTFSRLPISQLHTHQDQAVIEARVGRRSYTGSVYTSGLQLDMTERVAQLEHEPASLSAAQEAGQGPSNGSTARSHGSYLLTVCQEQQASILIPSDSGGGGGSSSSSGGGSALPELRLRGGVSGGSAAGRQQTPRLPRILSNESLVLDEGISAEGMRRGPREQASGAHDSVAEGSSPILHQAGTRLAEGGTGEGYSAGVLHTNGSFKGGTPSAGGLPAASPFAGPAAAAAPESESSREGRTMLEFDEEEDAELVAQLAVPKYKRAWLRNICISLTISVAILVAGITVRAVAPQTYVSGNFTAWRWLILIGCLAPAYWTGKALAHLFEAAVEYRYFENRRVLFYLIGTTKPLARMITMALLPMLWAVIFQQQAYINPAWTKIFNLVLRLLLCLFLFTSGLFLTTLIAKVLGRYFHKDVFFDKMADTLRKENYLWAISRPRDNLQSPLNLSAVPSKALKSVTQFFTVPRNSDKSAKKGTTGISGTQSRPPAHMQRRSEPVVPSSPARSTGAAPEAGRGAGPPRTATWAGRLQKLASVLGHSAEERRRVENAQVENMLEDEIFEEGVVDAPDAARERMLKRLQWVEEHIQQHTFAMTFDDSLARAMGSDSASREREAKRLAFYIFWNCKSEFMRHYIVVEDLYTLLPEDKAKKAFEMFDTNANGKVSQSEVYQAVLQIFTERKNLAVALKDTRSVVGTLTYVLGAILQAVFFFFYLLILRVSLDNMWISISSGVLSFSFIFGNTMNNQLQAIMLLFVVHPFDVGDRLLLGGPSASVGGDLVTVEQMSLNKTVVLRTDGARIWYPNTLLLLVPVLNVTRTDSRRMAFQMELDMGLDDASIKTLEASLATWMATKKSELKEGSLWVVLTGSALPFKSVLNIECILNFKSWEEYNRTCIVREEMCLQISKSLKELGLTYSLPAINVRPVGANPGRHSRARDV